MHGIKILTLLSLSSTMVSGSKRKLSGTSGTDAYAKQYCTSSRDRSESAQGPIDVYEQTLGHEPARVKTEELVPFRANTARVQPLSAKTVRTYNLQPPFESARVIAVQPENEIFTILSSGHRQGHPMLPPHWLSSASQLTQAIYTHWYQANMQMLYPQGLPDSRLGNPNEKTFRTMPTGKADEPRPQEVHKIVAEWKEKRTKLGGPAEPFVARPIIQGMPLGPCQVAQHGAPPQGVPQQDVPQVLHAVRHSASPQACAPVTPSNSSGRHRSLDWKVPELYWAMSDFANPAENIIPIWDSSVRSCTDFPRAPESFKYCQPEPPRGPSRYDRSNPNFDSGVFLV